MILQNLEGDVFRRAQIQFQADVETGQLALDVAGQNFIIGAGLRRQHQPQLAVFFKPAVVAVLPAGRPQQAGRRLRVIFRRASAEAVAGMLRQQRPEDALDGAVQAGKQFGDIQPGR